MNLRIVQHFCYINPKYLILFLCLLVVSQTIFPFSCIADPSSQDSDQLSPSTSGEDSGAAGDLNWPGVDKLNKSHTYLSSSVENLSRRIDTFFGEERVYEESTGTMVQARSSMIIDQDGEFDYDLKFRAKLKLPQLKDRFNLLIDNVDDPSLADDFSRDSKANSLKDEFQDTDLSASLQYMLTQTARWNISLRPGLKLSNPVEAYIRLRASREKQLDKRWLARGTEQIGYFSEDGLENELKFELERRTSSQEFFRSTTNDIWRESAPGNQSLGQSFLYVHIVNPRSSVAFEAGVTGETRPTLRNTSYFGNIRYRRDVHQGWLFMEISPRVIFARDNDYDEDVSLALTLEVLFGADYSR